MSSDRSRKVSSLQSFLTLLEHGKTAPKQFVFEGKLRPLREELLATLGNRILALPAKDLVSSELHAYADSRLPLRNGFEPAMRATSIPAVAKRVRWRA